MFGVHGAIQNSSIATLFYLESTSRSTRVQLLHIPCQVFPKCNQSCPGAACPCRFLRVDLGLKSLDCRYDLFDFD
jgi:hypothetical protein